VLLPFCTALTGIQQGDVDSAPLFPEAFAKLRERMVVGRERVVWGSWGQFDADQLYQDGELHRVAYEMPPHLNLKEALSEKQEWRRRFGMANALIRCGLRLEGVHHRGIDDAKNIARLMPWIVGDKRALKRDRRDQEKKRWKQ
jgi:inhibitor of KinA sporulation pathway (predicted exonuclease)